MSPATRVPVRWVTALVVLLVAMCGPAPYADAEWTSSATGAGTARSASLAPATNLVAVCGGLAATVRLTWTASADAWADGYEVHWGTSSGSYTSAASVTLSPYTTPSLGLGTWYFTVHATSQAWHSAGAAEVSKTVINVLGVGTCT